MYITLYEQLQKINDSEDVAVALKGCHPSVVTLLYHNFADWEWFLLPNCDPAYENEYIIPERAPVKLIKVAQKLKTFQRADLHKIKREAMFVELLETLPKDEAILLLKIKDKKLEELFPRITRQLVDEAFPELLVQKNVT